MGVPLTQAVGLGFVRSPRWGSPDGWIDTRALTARKKPLTGCLRLATRYTGAMGSRVVEAEYEKGMLKPNTPLTLRPGERVHLIRRGNG